MHADLFILHFKSLDLRTTAIAQAAGLIGCFRFLEGFYLLLVTQRRYHGTVCGKNALQALPLHMLSSQAGCSANW